MLDTLVMKFFKKNNLLISKKYCDEKHVDLLMIGDKGKIHYVLIKDFNTLMYDHVTLWKKTCSPSLFPSF